MYVYTGNGAYCYANSLHMCLHAAGADSLPHPGFLECLTTMPFGKLYVRAGEPSMFFPGSPAVEPDSGVTIALKTMGWTSDETVGGTEADALERLREAVKIAPVMVGPLDMGYLTFNPNYQNLYGSDHFVAVLGLEDDRLRVHDPAGFPYARVPISAFMQAWRADNVGYGRKPYVMRAHFRQVESLTRDKMIARSLSRIRSNFAADPNGPAAFGGAGALCALAEDLRGDAAEKMWGHLVYFALPLGARRMNDAAAFLTEAGLPEAAACATEEARLYGETVY
ncbi:MAG: hypothetical protein K8I30_01015, partial [Anaerolineae bacterium]|nr:hypothetical protein [Anaerolineae bacterium]